MKIIALLPVKNEEWILKETLSRLNNFCDQIIIGDQNSTDNSINIYKEFEKVEVIENNNKFHNNNIRWKLLDKAREKFGINNLIICIDADEIINPKVIDNIKEKLIDNNKAISFSFPWIQLWGNLNKYRIDSVWNNNYKSIIFFDNGNVEYKKEFVLNDHTGRIPVCDLDIKLNKFPLFHLQYLNLARSKIKQVWYKCSELLEDNDPKKINYKYSVSSEEGIILKNVPEEWIKILPKTYEDYFLKKDWRFKDIIDWFNKYGIKHFEALDIWYIKKLKDLFIKEIGREPRPKLFPKWLIKLNNLKNKLKNKI